VLVLVSGTGRVAMISTKANTRATLCCVLSDVYGRADTTHPSGPSARAVWDTGPVQESLLSRCWFGSSDDRFLGQADSAAVHSFAMNGEKPRRRRPHLACLLPSPPLPVINPFHGARATKQPVSNHAVS
jgi:hypothetical protein